MPPSPYFKQLAKELDGHPYKDRLLEELEDHLEDFKNDEDLPEVERKGQLTQRLFGEVREFKKVFIKIVDPWRNLFFVSQGLMMGVLLAVASLMFYIYLNRIGLNEFFISKSNFYSNPENLWPLILGKLFFAFIICFFGHLVAFRLLHNIKNLTSFGVKTWIFLISLPSLIIFLYKMIPFWFLWIPTWQSSSQVILKNIDPTIWFFAHSLVLFLSYKHYKISGTESKKIKWLNPMLFLNSLLFVTLFFSDFAFFSNFEIIALLAILMILNLIVLIHTKNKGGRKIEISSYLIFWLGVGAVLLRTLITYTDLNFWDQHPYFIIPLSPIFLLDSLFELIWSIDRSANWYIPIALLIYGILQSAFIIYRRKKLVFGHLFVFIYLLSFFFINPDVFVFKPEFKKNSFNISKIIEKDRLSIFYPYFKYFNSSKGDLLKADLKLKGYKYDISYYNVDLYSPNPISNYFIITDHRINGVYFIDINELNNNINEQNIVELVQKSPNIKFDSNEYFENLGDNPIDVPNITCGVGRLCSNIANQYSEEEIPFFVEDFAVSPDKKWLIGVFIKANSSLGEKAVYLVKLQ